MSGRKFRRKVVAAEDDEGNDEPKSLAVPPSSFKAREARQLKEKKEKTVGKSLLSFGDDEEAHGPVLGKEKAKAKASGFRPAAAAVLASSKPSAATQVSAPGESSGRMCCKTHFPELCQSLIYVILSTVLTIWTTESAHNTCAITHHA